METRDLLLLVGFLRGGKMFPVAVPQHEMPVQRSLRVLFDTLAERERALFSEPGDERGAPARPSFPSHPTASAGPLASHEELRQRSALTSWSGDFLAWTSRIGEVPDPGVVLCLTYEGAAAEAALPIDVFAQTLRRYVLRDLAMRARFEAHLVAAGTFVPPWLTPEVRRRRSQEAFDRAMKVAREQGFAAAAPLFEGVRGDCYAPAQIAVALHELRELGDVEGALDRLDEVLRVAPRNVAACLSRAQILMGDAGRRVEAAADWLAVLRELGRPEAESPSPEVLDTARAGLWALHREFANPRKLEAAAAIAKQDPERGFEAVSRYVHTHPCAWDAHILLASLALARQSFELTIKLLAEVRWLYAKDPNPHFVYGQALASKGDIEAAVPALEHAARIAPDDADVARWLSFAQSRLSGAVAAPESVGVKVAHHVVRTLLLLVGFVCGGRVHAAVLTLHRVPGDVSLELVVQALAGQERRRFVDSTPPPPSAEPPSVGHAPAHAEGPGDLRAVRERVVLLERSGARLSVEQLVGDVPDPGVVLALLYESVIRDAAGRVTYAPPLAECQKALAAVAQTDTEIAAKLRRHLDSPEATLLARLDLAE
jgi:tetratricopeptide (TPR) repeat protein